MAKLKEKVFINANVLVKGGSFLTKNIVMNASDEYKEGAKIVDEKLNENFNARKSPTVEQVQEIVDYAKYFPVGKRGFCPSRKDGWGFDDMAQQSVPDQMAYWNEQVLVIPQCETVGALENIETIVNMEGVDGIFIGPFDLSISMGIPGQFAIFLWFRMYRPIKEKESDHE